MKKEFGASAGVLALLAMFVHTQFPEVPERVVVSKIADGSTAKPKAAQSSGVDEPVEGPWLATRTYFSAEGSGSRCSSPSPDCTFSPAKLADPIALATLLGLPNDFKKNWRAWSIVATVADPQHTRLALYTDRQIEAIQRSMQSAAWDFVAQWLPWQDHFDATETDIVERRKQRRLLGDQQNIPGILIFRASDPKSDLNTLLTVMVVPETPTDGVNGSSFASAMHLAGALSTQDHNIGLLAPTFSGSFPSLIELIQSSGPATVGYKALNPWVYSGTVSSDSGARTLEVKGMKFAGGIDSNVDSQAAFCDILGRYSIATGDVAYLVEDETAFSDSFRTPFCQPQSTSVAVYTFPRDIAHLRNVYQDQMTGPAGGPTQNGRPGIVFSLKDPNSGEDSIPTFSDAQSPLSQDAIVKSIIDDFKRKRTRLISIVATNVLDTLFLAEVIRRESPDTRILLSEPDMLFVSAATQDPLTGTLSLSPYPMFFQGDTWLTEGRQHWTHSRFSSPEFQGVYNVTQLLLRKMGAASLYRKDGEDVLLGYRQLEPKRAHPGLWLLTLNRSGFLPIDLIDGWHDRRPPGLNSHEKWYEENPVSGLRRRFLLPRPPEGWFLTFVGLSAFIGFACLLVTVINFSDRGKGQVWLYLRDRQSGARFVTFLGAALSLSAMEWILIAPVMLSPFEPAGFPWRAVYLVIGVIAIAAPPLLALILGAARRTFGVSRTGLAYVAAILGMYALIVLSWYHSCGGMDARASRFFCYRALELYSGSSPAPPLLLFCAAGLGGCLFYWKRFTRAGAGRVRLDPAPLEKLGHFKAGYESLECQILGPACPEKGAASRLIAPVALVALSGILLGQSSIGAFENGFHNGTLAAVAVVLLLALTAASSDILLAWKRLDRLLTLAGAPSFRAAFARVTESWVKRPLWSRGPIVRNQCAFLQMQQTLEVYRDMSGAIAASARLAQYVRDMAGTAGNESWNDLFARLRVREKDCAELAAQMIRDDDGPLPDRLARADFVALQLARYFSYAVRQIKSMAWCISFEMLMLTLLLNSYSPQAPLLIGRYLAVLLAGVGAVITMVYAGMEKNSILSAMTRTTAGELGGDFWIQIVALGVLPLIGVLAHLFPEISGFLWNWAAPGLQATH